MAAFRVQIDGVQKAGDFALVRRMAEYRQAEGRFGNEDIAGNRLERRAGRIGAALVVARCHDPAATVFQHRLSTAKDMTGRGETDIDITDPQALAIGQWL